MNELKFYMHHKAKNFDDDYRNFKYKSKEVSREYLCSDYVKYLLTSKLEDYRDHPITQYQKWFNSYNKKPESKIKCPVFTTTQVVRNKHIPVIDIDKFAKEKDIIWKMEAFYENPFTLWSSGTSGHYWLFIDKIGSFRQCKKTINSILGFTLGSAIADGGYLSSISKHFPIRATPNANGCPHELHRSGNMSPLFKEWCDKFKDHYESKEIQNLNEYFITEWF